MEAKKSMKAKFLILFAKFDREEALNWIIEIMDNYYMNYKGKRNSIEKIRKMQKFIRDLGPLYVDAYTKMMNDKHEMTDNTDRRFM